MRVTVHKDTSYDFQCYAKLEVWNEREFARMFSADPHHVASWEPWEIENSLLESYGKVIGIPFSHFDSEGALFESGHLDDEQS